TGEWSWAEEGEARVVWAAVGDCWAACSDGCCWRSNGSVCPIVGVVRVGVGTVGCISKVSSKKVKGMSLAIAVDGKIFSKCVAILRVSTQKVVGRFAWKRRVRMRLLIVRTIRSDFPFCGEGDEAVNWVKDSRDIDRIRTEQVMSLYL
ncbi:hypothetical protein Tco_1441629, partial [Tanacetum coccineum]